MSQMIVWALGPHDGKMNEQMNEMNADPSGAYTLLIKPPHRRRERGSGQTGLIVSWRTRMFPRELWWSWRWQTSRHPSQSCRSASPSCTRDQRLWKGWWWWWWGSCVHSTLCLWISAEVQRQPTNLANQPPSAWFLNDALTARTNPSATSNILGSSSLFTSIRKY